jgi:FtsP/CotA-like multicopper oxidase with cupredoxin domain
MSSPVRRLYAVLATMLAVALPCRGQQPTHQRTALVATEARGGARDTKAVDAVPNDNRVSAGRLVKGVFTLHLEAREADWYPEQAAGLAIPMFAFAEAGQAPRTPGPMIRVPAGTEMYVTVRNTLSKPIRFRGLQDRSSADLDTTVIAPGAMQEFRFRVDIPGSYYYFARTEAVPLLPEPGVSRDAMLVGAFIVDPAGTKGPRNERVLLISTFADSIPKLGMKSEAADRIMRRELFPRPTWFTAAVNGKAWPYTERLSYNVGDTIHWRVINGSPIPHPMHLHGFYFDVNARGDGKRDTIFTPAQRRMAVTEWMLPGTTMSMTWVPTRAGNWVFHCHLTTHIADALRLGPLPQHSMGHAGHTGHAEESMAGLIVGISVAPRPGASVARDPVPRRKMRLFVTERANVYGDQPGYNYILQEGPTPPAADSIQPVSSTLVLRQNEPTEISVINRAGHMATIHWHGVELESFYDGVGDWSGWGSHLAPVIAPGDSFVVRLTPQRAGTFIYHSHSNEAMQLPSGLYGTLIVLPEKGNRDTTERVFLLGIGGPHEDARLVVNGSSAPPPVELRAGTPHRFRFINISPLETHTIQIVARDTVQQWRSLAKDGAELPPSQSRVQNAVLAIHPGETYDFEVLRQHPESLTMKIISPETITNRLAARARGVVRGALPRVTTQISLTVK